MKICRVHRVHFVEQRQLLRRLDDLGQMRQRPVPRRVVRQAADVRVVDAQRRVALVEDLPGPRLIGQESARQVAAEVAAERRAAEFDPAWDDLAFGVLALPGLGRMPGAGEIGMTVRQPWRRRGQIGSSVRISRYPLSRILNPLGDAGHRQTHQPDTDQHQYTERAPHSPSVSCILPPTRPCLTAPAYSAQGPVVSHSYPGSVVSRPSSTGCPTVK